MRWILIFVLFWVSCEQENDIRDLKNDNKIMKEKLEDLYHESLLDSSRHNLSF
jgi:hypothetical protein